MFDRFFAGIGRLLVAYLSAEIPGYQPSATVDFDRLRATLRIGDVLLVEGNTRVSVAIKYLTQSTWSHAALYVGDLSGARTPDGEPLDLVEVLTKEGCIASPLSRYRNVHVRICRPVGLSATDREAVARFMIARIGLEYDLRNILDLVRYLLPTPPVPVRWRRRMLALGSGSPTRAICSTLIALAFESLKYPILPDVTFKDAESVQASLSTQQEILHIRHHSLYTPRDFDLSPYFAVVKPTIETGFDFRSLIWAPREVSEAT